MINAYATEPVTFQSPVKADDGYGGNIIAWNDVAVVRIKLEPLSAREYFWALQIKVDISHKALCAYRTGLDEKMRFVHGDGRIFLVDSIIDLDEKHIVLEILCHQEKP